ncbi:MAG: hypothetical protein RLZZ546_1435 [Bacteroidota bacterium]|jgi:hypothetical protein
MKRNSFIIIGFLLFFLGFMSIVISLVGLKFDILAFLNKVGVGFAFLVHIIMVCVGLSLLYVGKTMKLS